MKGLVTKPQERLLFQSRPDCFLPTMQTRTFGFGGPFIAADSDGRVATDRRGRGSLMISNLRILVVCESDVREWPVESVVSAFGKKTFMGSWLYLSIANQGIAKFFWSDRKQGSPAADAAKIAVTGEG